jgi:hypothetical protein
MRRRSIIDGEQVSRSMYGREQSQQGGDLSPNLENIDSVKEAQMRAAAKWWPLMQSYQSGGKYK